MVKSALAPLKNLGPNSSPPVSARAWHGTILWKELSRLRRNHGYSEMSPAQNLIMSMYVRSEEVGYLRRKHNYFGPSCLCKLLRLKRQCERGLHRPVVFCFKFRLKLYWNRDSFSKKKVKDFLLTQICFTMHTQPPERPYTRRNTVILKGAKLQICAIFCAIGAIAQKK